MKIKINVTETDIINGERCNYYLCPIALAVKRQIGTDVQVWEEELEIQEKTIKLPVRANRFIKRFDISRALVKPFNFWLNVK